MIWLIVTVLILALLVAGAAYLMQVHRPSGVKGWRGLANRFLTWLRSGLERLLRRDRDDAPPSRFPAVMSRPAPARPAAGPVASGPEPPLAPLNVAPGEVPPVFIPALAWLAAFEPDSDEDMMGLGRGLAAFELAFAEAVDAALHSCIAPGIRLDPLSVAGMGDYADLRADSAHAAMDIWRAFLRVYDEVKQFRAAGGVLPKDGDFLTGDA